MAENKTPDLARIRDNQRRSRARRKEYLQELESKFRICERTGAEASSEIQSAARAVAAENKRLRLLLQQHGISDPELQPDAYQSPSAASLDYALSVRKPCGSSTDRGASAPPVQKRALQPRTEPEQQWEPYAAFTASNSSSSPYHLEEQHLPVQQEQQQIQPNLHSSSTSCYDIASVIRTVRPYMGTELEAQLGCADGRDCSIPNARAFELLDQISDSHHNG